MEEAARLCDRVAIMDHGQVIALGSPAGLVASLEADQILELHVQGKFDEAALARLPGVRSWRKKNEGYFLTVIEIGAALPALMAELERQGTRLDLLTTHQATLEDVFITLTGRVLRDG
jgi:ABC-2 type transport system ATP-binding protein